MYAGNDTDCTGDVMMVVNDVVPVGTWDGVAFGRHFFYDIDDFAFTCSAGVTDPISTQFTSDEYAVKV